jgi:hypothetical protein
MAYGGRIGIDDAHHNKITNNIIINTSVASQLGGYENDYTDNLFMNTRVAPKNLSTNKTAVLIEAYSSLPIKGNNYINNKIVNSEGVCLKISDAGGKNIYENNFKSNVLSGCGINENNISIVVEENSEGASYSNIFNDNLILSTKEKNISYRNVEMSVQEFNKQNTHDDQIKRNRGVKL